MRTRKPVDLDRVMANVALMIVAHRDKPCPTRDEVAEWTGLPQRRVWIFLRRLQAMGLLEMEARAVVPGNLRRLRLPGGAWTLWTERRTPTPTDLAAEKKKAAAKGKKKRRLVFTRRRRRVATAAKPSTGSP